MIHLLILAASLAQAQEVSTTTEQGFSVLDEVKVSNLGKDTRSLLSGRYTQTGKPTFKNGFCFGDATCQTTSAVFTAPVVASSFGVISPFSASYGTDMGECVATSTRTITVTKTVPLIVSVSLQGGFVTNTDTMDAAFCFLIDGAFPPYCNKDLGFSGIDAAVNAQFAGDFQIPAVAAGSHSVCLAIHTGNGGTFTAPVNGGGGVSGLKSHAGFFGVKELY